MVPRIPIASAAVNAERFWTKTELLPSGCLQWTAQCTKRGGYGKFKVAGRTVAAHRVAWVLAGRELVAGMELDHLCRNPACVNVAHLEQVTPRVNLQRRLGTETHCPHGHERVSANQYIDSQGKHHCRPCSPEHAARRRAKGIAA